MKLKKVILGVILSASLLALIFSSYKLIRYKLESDYTNNQIIELEKIANIEEFDDEDNNDENICGEHGESCDDMYWKYLKTPFIDVDLSALKKENYETIGWIQVLGTNINYPFVQTSDNHFYLYHSFDNSINSAGWVFLDYRNSNLLTDANNIIYAHGRLDNTMFGSLRNLLKTEWINNPENYLIRTKTENNSSVWQIFSVYVIPTTSDYLQTNFYSDYEKTNFLNFLKNRSQYRFNTEVTGSDKIITLSTCYDDYSRMVVHAKLIKSSQN